MKTNRILIIAVVFNLVFYPFSVVSAGKKLPVNKPRAEIRKTVRKTVKKPVKTGNIKPVMDKNKISYNFLKELELNPNNQIAYELFKGLDSELTSKAALERQWWDEAVRLINIKAGELLDLIKKDGFFEEDKEAAPGETMIKNIPFGYGTKPLIGPSKKKEVGKIDAKIYGPIEKPVGKNQYGATGQKVADVKTTKPFSWDVDSPLLTQLTAEFKDSGKTVSESLYDGFMLFPKISAPLRALTLANYTDLRLLDLGRYKTRVLGVRDRKECQTDPILERHIPGYMTSIVREDYKKALAHLIAIHRFTQCGSVKQLQILESVLIDTIEDAMKMHAMGMSGDGAGLYEKLGLVPKINAQSIKSTVGYKAKLDFGKGLKIYEKDMTPAVLHGAALNVVFALFNANKAVFSRAYGWMCKHQKEIMESMQEGMPAFKFGLWGNSIGKDASYFIPLKPYDPAKDKVFVCQDIPQNLASDILTPYGLNKAVLLQEACVNLPMAGPAPQSGLPTFGQFFGNFMNTANIAFGFGDLSNAGIGIPLAEGLCSEGGGGGGGGGGGYGSMNCHPSHGGGQSVPPPFKMTCQPNPGAVPRGAGGIGDPSPNAANMSGEGGLPGGFQTKAGSTKETTVDMMDWMEASFCSSALNEEDPTADGSIGVEVPLTDAAKGAEIKKQKELSEQAKDKYENGAFDDLWDAAQKKGQKTYSDGDKAEAYVNLMDASPDVDFGHEKTGVDADGQHETKGTSLGLNGEEGKYTVMPGAPLETHMEEQGHHAMVGLGLSAVQEEGAISCSGINPKTPAEMENYANDVYKSEEEKMKERMKEKIKDAFGGGSSYPTDDSVGCNMAFKNLAMTGALCKESPGAKIDRPEIGGPDPMNPWAQSGGSKGVLTEGGGGVSVVGGGIGGVDCLVAMGDACFKDSDIECEINPTLSNYATTKLFGLWDPVPNELNWAKDPQMLQKLPPFMRK